MNEPKKPNDERNESPAIDPPTPIDKNALPRAVDIGLGSIALTLAGAGAIVLIGGALTPTVGATQSAKLEWRRRELLIEQAEREVAESDENDEQSRVRED